MTGLLEVRGLSAGYGGMGGQRDGMVLREVDLSVPAGAAVAVLGANGAGKTTLLRSIAGLVRPSAGTIILDGTDLAPVPVEHRVRLGLAYVPQEHAVVTELTVAENLRLGGLWRRDRTAADRAATARTLAGVYELFGPLARRRGLVARHLSGGERRMLAIGRALMARPRLLLLDEPTLGLAPPAAAQLAEVLGRLREKTGLAVLLAEQDRGFARSVAGTAVVMSLGRVVATGRAVDLAT